VWPSRFKTVEDAVKFVRQPELLANTVYANRMGNRGPASGDGWKYRGRGIFMLTGRSNYTAAGDSLGRPYKDDPDLLAQPEDAVLTAGWFWASSGCNAMSDMAKITKRVNGGSHGLAERIAIYNRLMEMINE
jgi:putative chitinase